MTVVVGLTVAKSLNFVPAVSVVFVVSAFVVAGFDTGFFAVEFAFGATFIFAGAAFGFDFATGFLAAGFVELATGFLVVFGFEVAAGFLPPAPKSLLALPRSCPAADATRAIKVISKAAIFILLSFLISARSL